MDIYKHLPILKQHKLYLQDFWLLFDNVGSRYLKGNASKEFIIDKLLQMGEINLHYRSPTHTRENWDKRKIKVKKFNKFVECFACGVRPQVRHHIIWLSHGGRNQKNNIIGLCKSCHSEIHPWLK